MQQLFILISFIFCFVTEGAVPSYTKYERRNIGTENLPEPDNHHSSNITVIFVDVGSNYTLPCNGRLTKSNGVWRWDIERDSHDKTKVQHTSIQEDGSLFFSSLLKSDSGIYSCQLESDLENDDDEHNRGIFDDNDDDEIKKKSLITTTIKNITPHSTTALLHNNININSNNNKHNKHNNLIEETRVRLKVRTPPLLMKNVTVLPSTVLASVMWETGDDGGYPISSFQIRYRLENESEIEWKNCQPNFISPDKRHIDIFHLHPNSTYIFEMWANNHLGQGYSSLVVVSTHNDPQEIEGKYILEGVEILDTKGWIVAVLIVLGILLILVVATCCLFYKEYSMSSWTNASGESRRSRFDVDGETIELTTNIILNPAFEIQSMMEPLIEPDENLNDTTPRMRVNNNSVVFPTRV